MFYLSAYLWQQACGIVLQGSLQFKQPKTKQKRLRYLCGCAVCERFSDILAAHPLRIA